MLSIQPLFVFKVLRLFSSFIVTQEIAQTNIVDYSILIVVIQNFILVLCTCTIVFVLMLRLYT